MSKTKRVAYLVISTRKAVKQLEDGRNAHLIVETPEYWYNKISQYFKILRFEFKNEAVYIIAKSVIVEPRKETPKNEYDV
jgi:hypothetical protein